MSGGKSHRELHLRHERLDGGGLATHARHGPYVHLTVAGVIVVEERHFRRQVGGISSLSKEGLVSKGRSGLALLQRKQIAGAE